MQFCATTPKTEYESLRDQRDTQFYRRMCVFTRPSPADETHGKQQNEKKEYGRDLDVQVVLESVRRAAGVEIVSAEYEYPATTPQSHNLR